MYDDVGRVLANEATARGVARRVDTDEVSRRDAIMMVSIIQFYGWVSCSLVAIASLTYPMMLHFRAKIFSVRKVYLGSLSFQRMRWVGWRHNSEFKFTSP